MERFRERAFRVHGSERRLRRGPPVRGRRGRGQARGARGGGKGRVPGSGTAGRDEGTRRRWRVRLRRLVGPLDVRRRVRGATTPSGTDSPAKGQGPEPRHAPRRRRGAKPRDGVRSGRDARRPRVSRRRSRRGGRDVPSRRSVATFRRRLARRRRRPDAGGPRRVRATCAWNPKSRDPGRGVRDR